MIAAVLLAAAIALVVVRPPRHRLAALSAQRSARAEPRLDLVAAGCVLIGCVTVIGGPWGLLVGLAAAPPTRSFVSQLERGADRRRDAQVAAGLPGALDLIVAALGAGRSAGSAVTLVAGVVDEPVRTELQGVARRLAVSADPLDVWRDLSSGPLAPLGRAMRRCATSGAPAAHLVAAAADDLRREERALATRRARAVGVSTAAPLGLCFLPAFFCIGIVPVIIGAVADLMP